MGMLPGFVIEEIRRRERLAQDERPQPTLPIPELPKKDVREDADPNPDRGSFVIDVM